MQKLKIYLDSCCFCRPFDDLSQDKIRQFENGKGNYTEERDELFKDLSIDDIVASIKRQKE